MPKKTFTLRTTEEILKKLEKIAEANARSMNGEIEFLIKESIRLYEKKNGVIEVSLPSNES